MSKTTPKYGTPAPWVANLRTHMERTGFNPRSLSLRAGLNPTAIRDVLEGRARYPRYDTIQALAKVLGITPAILMSDKEHVAEIEEKGPDFHNNLDLLTEIIARLQETLDELGQKLEPREFAAMATAIYQRLQTTANGDQHQDKLIGTQIHDLLDYELIRRKRAHL